MNTRSFLLSALIAGAVLGTLANLPLLKSCQLHLMPLGLARGHLCRLALPALPACPGLDSPVRAPGWARSPA